jgi:hypothetical protein
VLDKLGLKRARQLTRHAELLWTHNNDSTGASC